MSSRAYSKSISTTNRSVRISKQSYFYKNGFYIGSYLNGKRYGIGLTLFHTYRQESHFFAAITSLNRQQQYHGHSIFYGRRILVSTQFDRNRLDSIAYRIDGYLLFLQYNNLSKIDGKCFLIDYTSHQITMIIYDNGEIVGIKTQYHPKQMNEEEFKTNLFTYGKIDGLVGIKHANAINHTINKVDNPRVKSPLQYQISNVDIKRIGNKVEIAYISDPSQPNTSRLITPGFSFLCRSPNRGGFNPEKNIHEDDFQLQLIEKGSYVNRQAQGFGQKNYRNNNFYVGYFSSGNFHGEGVLRNAAKGKWAYGIFEGGEMVQLIDSSNENKSQKCEYYIEKFIQKHNSPIYNPTAIEQIDFHFADQEIEKIFLYKSNNYYHAKQQTFENRKKNFLKRITAQFIENEEASCQYKQPQINNPGSTKSPHRIKFMVNKELAQKNNKQGSIRPQKQPSLSFDPSKIEENEVKQASDQEEQYKNKRIRKIFKEGVEYSPLKLNEVQIFKSSRLRKSKIFRQLTPKLNKNFKLEPGIQSSSLEKRRKSARAKIFPKQHISKSKDEISGESPHKIYPQTYRETSNVKISGHQKKYPNTARNTNIFDGPSKQKKDLFNYNYQNTGNKEESRQKNNDFLSPLVKKYRGKTFGNSVTLGLKNKGPNLSPTY